MQVDLNFVISVGTTVATIAAAFAVADYRGKQTEKALEAFKNATREELKRHNERLGQIDVAQGIIQTKLATLETGQSEIKKDIIELKKMLMDWLNQTK